MKQKTDPALVIRHDIVARLLRREYEGASRLAGPRVSLELSHSIRILNATQQLSKQDAARNNAKALGAMAAVSKVCPWLLSCLFPRI